MVARNASVSRPIQKESRALIRYVLVFSIAFLLLVVGPPFLGYSFPPYPLMKVADVLDLFTPLVLIPLYWLMFRLYGEKSAGVRENVVFMVLVAFFVLGQGMHLAANSIGHLTEGMAGTDIYKLTSFYDETLSHYLWHFGVIGLSASIAFRQSRNPLAEAISFDWRIALAAAVYGFTFFAMVIEGATVPMGLPFAVLFVAASLIFARKALSRQPVLYFFLLAYIASLLFFAIWGVWQHGLPEFSKAGIIK